MGTSMNYVDYLPQSMGTSMNYRLVDEVNSDSYSQFLGKLTESKIVAIDAEWDREVPLCLLQFAFRTPSNHDEVFVLNVMKIPLGTVYNALKKMFTNKYIVKLGFRFVNDLRQFTTAAINDLAEKSEMEFLKVAPYLAIEDVYGLIMVRNDPSWVKPGNMVGLAKVCEDVLAERISKKAQSSNWSHRSLTVEQLQYAAKDAWCLLQIFDKLIAGNKETFDSLRFDELQLSRKDIASMERKRTTSKEQKRRKDKPTEESTALTISTQSYGAGPKKFVCDETVEKLCRMMRLVGIDTGFFAYVEEANEGDGKGKRKDSTKQLHLYGCSVDQAIMDERIVLTRKHSEKLNSLTPVLRTYISEEHKLYVVESEKKYDQLVEVIKRLDLKISKEDLMTRCLKCNELSDRLNCKNCGATKSQGNCFQGVIMKLTEVGKL